MLSPSDHYAVYSDKRWTVFADVTYKCIGNHAKFSLTSSNAGAGSHMASQDYAKV